MDKRQTGYATVLQWLHERSRKAEAARRADRKLLAEAVERAEGLVGMDKVMDNGWDRQDLIV